MNFGNRKEIFRALVGSHNYNMNTEESDKDYKVFIAPTFDDLFSNNMYSETEIGEDVDYDVHDIRKIANLFWKSNVNFMEVLFSEEITVPETISETAKKNLEWIFENKEQIARINLPYLFNACVGMHINKVKLIDKYTTGTEELYNKYGYDTKSAMHSIRILLFLEEFSLTYFKDFKKAIWMDEENKEFLLNIKNGMFTREEFIKCAEDLKCKIEGLYKEQYYAYNPNEKLKEELTLRIKEIVRSEMV